MRDGWILAAAIVAMLTIWTATLSPSFALALHTVIN